MENTELKKQREPREDLTADERLLIPKFDPAYEMPKDLFRNIQLDVAAKKNVMLTGHAGTSKTSMIMQFASMINQPVMRANMNGQTSISDFVGYNSVINGDVVFIYGVLPYCMKRGIWLIIDEFDYADAPVLSVLNSVAEEGGKLMLKEKGCEMVEPHSSFRLFGTANTIGCMEEFRHIYQGTNPINSALLDRFSVYKTNYLLPEQEEKVLIAKVPNCPAGAAKGLVTLANDIRGGFEAQTLDSTFSIRGLFNLAEMLTRIRDEEMAKTNNRLDETQIMTKAIDLAVTPRVSQKDALAIKNMAVNTVAN